MKSIVQHVVKSTCKITYSKEQEASLRKHSQEISTLKKAKLEERKKSEIASRKAKNYQLKKVKIAGKYQRSKAQIAGKYQKNKVKIAEEYQKKKSPYLLCIL